MRASLRASLPAVKVSHKIGYWIDEGSIIDLREDFTYGVYTSVPDETKLHDMKAACKEIVDQTKQIIYR